MTILDPIADNPIQIDTRRKPHRSVFRTTRRQE
jgi:hypothetical protein